MTLWEQFALSHSFLFCLLLATISISVAIAVYGSVAKVDSEFIKKVVEYLTEVWILTGIGYFLLLVW